MTDPGAWGLGAAVMTLTVAAAIGWSLMWVLLVGDD